MTCWGDLSYIVSGAIQADEFQRTRIERTQYDTYVRRVCLHFPCPHITYGRWRFVSSIIEDTPIRTERQWHVTQWGIGAGLPGGSVRCGKINPPPPVPPGW